MLSDGGYRRHVTSKNENDSDDSDEVTVNAAKGIERDIEDLLR